MIGVNSGDGRGNITAYVTVFDSNARPAVRPRLLGLLAGNGALRPSSFACGGSATSAGGRFTDFATFTSPVDTADSFRDFDCGRPVQLRSAEPLPASGRAATASARWATTSSTNTPTCTPS